MASKLVFVSLPFLVGSIFTHYLVPSTIQVTGASGFTGSHVVSQLLRQGYRVRGYGPAHSVVVTLAPLTDDFLLTSP